jgi:hypothetical protein
VETPKLARKDAVKALVDKFDETLKLWAASHPDKIHPEWGMGVTMSYGKWRQIIEALRPLSKD